MSSLGQTKTVQERGVPFEDPAVEILDQALPPIPSPTRQSLDQPANELVNLTPYDKTHRSGRRIVSALELLEFRVPRFVHIGKGGDIDFVTYYINYGPRVDKVVLMFMFGPLAGGYEPHDLANTSIKWTARNLICGKEKIATDWHGSTVDGRRWHHVGFPAGFADYSGVPSNAADYFDKILDSVTCGRGAQ